MFGLGSAAYGGPEYVFASRRDFCDSAAVSVALSCVQGASVDLQTTTERFLRYYLEQFKARLRLEDFPHLDVLFDPLRTVHLRQLLDQRSDDDGAAPAYLKDILPSITNLILMNAPRSSPLFVPYSAERTRFLDILFELASLPAPRCSLCRTQCISGFVCCTHFEAEPGSAGDGPRRRKVKRYRLAPSDEATNSASHNGPSVGEGQLNSPQALLTNPQQRLPGAPTCVGCRAYYICPKFQDTDPGITCGGEVVTFRYSLNQLSILLSMLLDRYQSEGQEELPASLSRMLVRFPRLQELADYYRGSSHMLGRWHRNVTGGNTLVEPDPADSSPLIDQSRMLLLSPEAREIVSRCSWKGILTAVRQLPKLSQSPPTIQSIVTKFPLAFND